MGDSSKLSDFLPSIGGLVSSGLSALTSAVQGSKQRDFAKEMWRMNNEYNTPRNQVKRLREAGLNPALAMQNGAVGSGVSSSPASGYSPVQADFSPIAQGLRSGVELMQQRRMNEAQIANTQALTEAQRYKNMFGLQRAYADLINVIQDNRQKGKNTDFLEKQADYMTKQINAYDQRNTAEVNRIEQEAAKYEKEAALADLQIAYQRIVNQFAPDQQAQILKNLKATEEQILAAAYASNTQGAYNLALKALSKAQKDGVDIDNEIKDEIAWAIVDEAESKADEAYWNSQERAKEYRFGKKGAEYLPDSESALSGGKSHVDMRKRPRRKLSGSVDRSIRQYKRDIRSRVKM